MVVSVFKFYILWLFLVTISSKCLVNGATTAIMSIDLGNENIKIGVVSFGKGFETVLNPDSSRKTPLAVGFRDGERFFRDAALNTGARFPEKVFTHLLDLIGKKIDNPLVQLYQKRFPFYKITNDSKTSNIVLNHPDGDKFTPEELLAMLLEKARDYTEAYVGNHVKIHNCVIVVPSYFTQSERKAILKSAELGGLNVLQLVNSNTAVALNFGLYRINDFLDHKPKNFIFYDMGSSSTTATVVSYQLRKNKDSAYSVKTPELTIQSIAFDRTLGGFEMQLRLRNFLAEQFSKQTKITLNEIYKNKRAMSKLLKEAGRVKSMLSANNEISARVENVMNDIDLKFVVKRSDFEDLCLDLFERVLAPIENALLKSGLTMDDIEQIVLFGGNTRTPKVQQILSDFSDKKDLGKSINTDEAACLGSVYLAAKLSKGYKAKDFNIIENNVYPFVVEFLRNNEEKLISRILFSNGNSYPMKKVFTFNKKNSDFNFSLVYGDLSFLNKGQEKYVDNKNLLKIDLKNFDSFISKYQDEKYEHKVVKVYFDLNQNGILSFINAEYVCNEKVTEQNGDINNTNILENTFSSFGDTISNFFFKNETENSLNNENKSNETQVNLNKTVPQFNITKEKPKDRILTFKEPIESIVHELDYNYNEENLSKSKLKLKKLNDQDEKKLARYKAINTLESFIVENKIKLYEDEYEKVSTEKERESLVKVLEAASEWLDFESDKVEESVLKNKIRELESNFENLFKKVQEHKERPEALNSLNVMLNLTKTFLDNARNLSEEQQVFTEVELTQLNNLLASTEVWVQEKTQEQDQTPLHETPKLLVVEIYEKVAALDREIKYLVNKAKIAQKKIKEKKNSTEPETTNKTSDSSNENDNNSDDVKKSEQKLNLTEENFPDHNIPTEDLHSEL